MSNLLDNICKLRDLFENKKDLSKFKFARGLMTSVFNEVHRQMAKKAKDPKHNLEFTAQDLRELTEDIRAFIKHIETEMNPDRNIKATWKTSELVEGVKQLSLDDFMNKMLPLMAFRRDHFAEIYELLSLLEYHSVYLYYLEMANKDEFALKYTERVIK